MRTRVSVGREPVLSELRAAAPLARRLRAPVTARAPWLTAAVNAQTARGRRSRPVAVVVEPAEHEPPVAAAFLQLVRRGATTAVALLGDGVAPAPPGRPGARLLAVDDEAATRLADGIAAMLGTVRGPWSLRLAGLPLGDPTARRLAARFPAARMATDRTTRLEDGLDVAGPVVRSRDARALEAALPGLLAGEPDPDARTFLRAAARLHAVTRELELAVVPDGDGGAPGGALLTLVEGADRWPWWASPGLAGIGTERGAPAAGLVVPARSWLPAPDVARRLGTGRR
jgi:hypothetical protein